MYEPREVVVALLVAARRTWVVAWMVLVGPLYLLGLLFLFATMYLNRAAGWWCRSLLKSLDWMK